jgi:hypothetical protein
MILRSFYLGERCIRALIPELAGNATFLGLCSYLWSFGAYLYLMGYDQLKVSQVSTPFSKMYYYYMFKED